MKKIWVTTDTHYNHARIIEFGRPKDYEERITKGFRDNVKDGDIIIHLGDLCIGKDELAMEKLLGALPEKHTLVLVRGNHDNKSDFWYMDRGFDMVCSSLTIKRFGVQILLTHIPSRLHYGDFNVHGHTHGNSHRDDEVRPYYDKKYHIEVALENTNYLPLDLEKIIQSKI